MKKIVSLVCCLALILVFAGCDAKDSCLDQGGTYDETTKTCDTAN